MIKTYLLEGKTELEYAYQVKTKEKKYTVDAVSVFDTKQEAFEALIDRRWTGYKGKTMKEIAEILKVKNNENWENHAADIVKEMKNIMKKAWINN